MIKLGGSEYDIFAGSIKGEDTKEDALKVSVLGTEYTIHKDVREDDEPLIEDKYGYVDLSVKEIFIAYVEPKEIEVSNYKSVEDGVIRHELVHAFIHESGLQSQVEWADDEMLVDWLALQIPKMAKLFRDMDIL